MATLTPLAKGLIGLTIIGGVVSAVWNLGLKEHFAGAPAATGGSVATGSAVQSIAVPPTLPTAVPPASTSRPAPAAVPPAPTAVPAAATQVAPAAGAQALTAAESSEKGRQLLEAGNYAQARIFLEQAVKMGDGPAACRLGEMTLKGQGGIAADRDKSASLFQLAQSRGMICFASGQ